MKISVNGQLREVLARTVALVLDELDLGEATVATALNEEFLPAAARATQALNEEDRLEILIPMKGG